jgi:hypothetical protein
MKFILMMHAPWGETGDWQIFKYPPKAFEKHIEFLTELNRELEKEGVLVAIDGLAPPNQAKLVKANAKGGPPTTDGPFPESKEFLAGWWIIDVESPEKAYEIAGRASAAPGPDGKPLNMGIEVRQVISGSPTEGRLR